MMRLGMGNGEMPVDLTEFRHDETCRNSRSTGDLPNLVAWSLNRAEAQIERPGRKMISFPLTFPDVVATTAAAIHNFAKGKTC